MYASKIILATMFAIAASAASVPRQAGNAACNTARREVVTSLGTASTSIAQIQDPTVKTAAQAGLDQATGGIKAIAQTLKAGQTASAAGRDEVQAGLGAMSTALTGGSAADPAVASALAAVQAAATAGISVVNECKPE